MTLRSLITKEVPRIGILDMKYTLSDLQIEIPIYVCSSYF